MQAIRAGNKRLPRTLDRAGADVSVFEADGGASPGTRPLHAASAKSLGVKRRRCRRPERAGNHDPCQARIHTSSKGGLPVLTLTRIAEITRSVLNHRSTAIAVALTACATLAIHFSVLAVYLSPLNPLKLALDDEVMQYVNPLFTQNWHLFAPTPVNTSLSLLGKCREQDVESEWLDITHGTLKQLRAKPFLQSHAYLAALQQNIMRSYVYGLDEPDELLFNVCLEEPEIEYCRTRARASDKAREFASAGLARLVTNACLDNGFPNVDSVHIRIADLEFPRFSSRLLPDAAGDARYADIEWQPSLIGRTH